MEYNFHLDEWDTDNTFDAHNRCSQLETIVMQLNERLDVLARSHSALADEVKGTEKS